MQTETSHLPTSCIGARGQRSRNTRESGTTSMLDLHSSLYKHKSCFQSQHTDYTSLGNTCRGERESRFPEQSRKHTAIILTVPIVQKLCVWHKYESFAFAYSWHFLPHGNKSKVLIEAAVYAVAACDAVALRGRLSYMETHRPQRLRSPPPHPPVESIGYISGEGGCCRWNWLK